MKDRIAKFWTKNCPYRDKEDKQRFIDEPNVKELIDSFIEKDKKILEVGSGKGIDTRYMRSKGADVTAVDLSPENARLSGGICMDAENLDFPDESFDIVYSFGVLHHTPDTQKAIKEVYRVLKPKGKAIIMLYHKGYAYWLLKLFNISTNNYDHTPLSKMYSKEDVNRLFSKFSNYELSMTTFAGNKLAWRIFKRNKFLMDRFGSFIVIKAIK